MTFALIYKYRGPRCLQGDDYTCTPLCNGGFVCSDMKYWTLCILLRDREKFNLYRNVSCFNRDSDPCILVGSRYRSFFY